jgi:hypothetical protein
MEKKKVDIGSNVEEKRNKVLSPRRPTVITETHCMIYLAVANRNMPDNIPPGAAVFVHTESQI